jgi:hypothetical protein
MKTTPRASRSQICFGKVLPFALLYVIGVICGSGAILAAQKPQHTGTKVEGFATIVTSDSITIFDKKSQMIEIHTDKDYSALVGIAAPVTVWYKTEGGINRLEDIEYPTQAATFVPPDLIRENIKRIIILPRPEGVDDTDRLVSAISKYLADNTGWYIAPPELAVEIASRTKGPTSPLDAINPDTGQVDMQQYLDPQRTLMMAIANETHSDAVLEIQVVKVKATVRAGIASWDDMTEPVASRKTRSLTPWEGFGKGWVFAVSTDMNLYSQSGKLLWKKRRGFAVLGVQSGVGGKYRERPLKEVYDDNDTMQRWLIGTLSQLAPPVKGVTVDSPQLSPELQKELDKAKQAGEDQK